jgi:beta-galactosidase
MLGSETASCISSRGEYYLPVDEEKPPNRENLQVNSYDLATTPWATTPDQEFSGLDENPSVMGEFVWTGFDYLGEPTPYNEYHSRSSYFGIVDLAGIPKSRYWLYKSRWSTDPVLYIHPHWTWDHEGQLVPVHCYTNYPQVELFVNGRSQGRRIKQATTLLNRHRLVWPGVAYEPGELRAVGYDHQGLPVGEFVVRTAGDPDALSLVCDRSQIYADSEDMAFITVGVVDAAGTIVPNSQATITVTAEGAAEIVAVCNGDPTDYTSFQSASMKAFHGQCVVYLRATRETGRAVVTAQAGGVKPASIAIETLPVS